MSSVLRLHTTFADAAEMLQTINSHLSMAIRCTSAIMQQSQFMILSCAASLSTKDTAPQISIQLHPSAALSVTDRAALMFTRMHHVMRARGPVCIMCAPDIYHPLAWEEVTGW